MGSIERSPPRENPPSSGRSLEKDSATVTDLEPTAERWGYVLDAELVGDRNVRTAKDGRTVLIPQPTDDPNDPLNWSTFKKHLILIIISATALLPDYGSATGAVTLIPQAAEWHMTQNNVNHSQVGNVFMLGAAGPIVVALAAYFGRFPVTFYFVVLALATAIWCAAAMTFPSFMAARILNGFFSTVTQGGGLMFIQDLFFFHEHARKINIWSGFIILSPYLGPLFAAFIISTQKWQWAFGVYSIETGLCLFAIILFLDETYYNRKLAQQPPRGSRWKRMLGLEQRRSGLVQTSFMEAVSRPAVMITKPPVFLSTFYYLITFAWVVGINTTLSIFLTPLYNFGPKQIGFFYFTPIVAAILGELVGHWLHDFVGRTAARRKGGHFEPEARLAVMWISTPFMIAGLILLGFALQRAYHYMITALGWGLYVFGIMITTVGINAYVLDSYPEASGEVAAWINFGRTTGGFIVSYFMVTWAGKMGTIKQFSIMAGIVVFGFLMILGLQRFGKTMRLRAGHYHS